MVSLHTYDSGILISPSLSRLSLCSYLPQEMTSARKHQENINLNINKKLKRISTGKSSLDIKWISLNPFLKKTNGDKT